MSEVKDPTIKLFGKTIELPETVETAAETAEICEAADKENSSNQNPICSSNYSALEGSSCNGDAEDQESQQSQPDPTQADPKDENRPHPSPPNEKDPNALPMPDVDSNEDDPTESSNSHDNKTLKKPDKILPCPRCNSMDTKFCYFNNYNVNQPRHFCRNCQRYWTAGGTMRNVAIGAGRRKNKNFLASQFRHIEGSSCARAMNPNDALVTFGSGGTPLCESMVSVLNIADRTVTSSKENNGDGCSSGSSVSSPKDEVPFFCGPPWPYTWQNPVQWSSPTSLPTFALPSFPLPFYSTTSPYWAGPSIWNGPFVISPTTASSSGLNSPILGKHSRDGETQKESNDPDKCLWAPKTSRIDDQGEVAKNSFILATLGTKNDDDCVGKSSLFKAFQKQPKDVEKTRVQENSTVLQVNPAA